MSTVPEVMVARHCGMTVFAFSLITNECITDYDAQGEANHEEVIETANKRQNDLNLFVTRVVSSMAKAMLPTNGKNGSLNENWYFPTFESQIARCRRWLNIILYTYSTYPQLHRWRQSDFWCNGCRFSVFLKMYLFWDYLYVKVAIAHYRIFASDFVSYIELRTL